MVYNGRSMFAYLKITLLRVKRKKQPVIGDIAVEKGIFLFWGCQNMCAHTGIPV